MSWLNIFLVPDYLWLIAENFPSLDATLNLLATCKSIKAAGSDYLWNLRILREVKIRVHDWFMMVAVEICHSLGYHLVRRTRGFDFYAQYLSGLQVLLWTGRDKEGVLRICVSPATAPEVISTLSVIPLRDGHFRACYQMTHQLLPTLNERESRQSSDLMEILDYFKPTLTKQLQQMSDEMKEDDNFDDDYYDDFYAPFGLEAEFAPVEHEFGDALDHGIGPAAVPVEEAPEIIIIEDEVIVPVEEAPVVIIVEDEVIIIVD